MASLRNRSALEQDYSTLTQDYGTEERIAPEVPMASGEELRARGMGDFRRGQLSTKLSLDAGALYSEADHALVAGQDTYAEVLVDEAKRLEARSKTYSPEVASVGDVEGVGSGLDYIQSGLGSLAATIVEPMAGAAAGAAAGFIIAGPAGATIGGLAGAFTPSYDMAVSEHAGSQRGDETLMATTSPEERIHQQRVTGVISAALDVIVPGKIGGRVFGLASKNIAKNLSKEAAEIAVEKVAKQSLRRTRTVGGEMLIEGLTEVGQAKASQVGLTALNEERDTSHDVMELIDSFIIGSFGGLVMSGAGSAAGYGLEKFSRDPNALDLNKSFEDEDGIRRRVLPLERESPTAGGFIPDSQTEQTADKDTTNDDRGFIPDDNSINAAIARLNNDDQEFIADTHFSGRQGKWVPSDGQKTWTEEQKDELYNSALERMTDLETEIKTLETETIKGEYKGLKGLKILKDKKKELAQKKRLHRDLKNLNFTLVRDVSPGSINAHVNSTKEEDIINEAEAQDERNRSLNLFIGKGGVTEIQKRGILAEKKDEHLKKLVRDKIITKEEADAAVSTPLGDTLLEGGSIQDLQNYANDMLRGMKEQQKEYKGKKTYLYDQVTKQRTDLESALQSSLESGNELDLQTELNKYVDIRGPADFTPTDKAMQSVSKNMTSGPEDTKDLQDNDAIRVKRTDGKIHIVYKKDLKREGSKRFGWDKNNMIEALSADPSFVAVVDKNGNHVTGETIYEALKLKRPKSDKKYAPKKTGYSAKETIKKLKKQLAATKSKAQIRKLNKKINAAQQIIDNLAYESDGSVIDTEANRTAIREEIVQLKKIISENRDGSKPISDKAFNKALDKLEARMDALHTPFMDRGEQATTKGAKEKVVTEKPFTPSDLRNAKTKLVAASTTWKNAVQRRKQNPTAKTKATAKNALQRKQEAAKHLRKVRENKSEISYEFDLVEDTESSAQTNDSAVFGEILADLQGMRKVRRLEESVVEYETKVAEAGNPWEKGRTKAKLNAIKIKLSHALGIIKRGGFNEMPGAFESTRTRTNPTRKDVQAGENSAQRIPALSKQIAALNKERRKAGTVKAPIDAKLEVLKAERKELLEAKKPVAKRTKKAPGPIKAKKTATKPKVAPRESAKPVTTERVKLKKKGPYTAKDQRKSDQANKFIGQGSENSSTNSYREDWGDRANTGKYTSDDRVFVSVEGNRRGRLGLNVSEIMKAINAGVTFIADSASDRQRPYNIGERQLAQVLSSRGYTESKGVWTKIAKSVFQGESRTTPSSPGNKILKADIQTEASVPMMNMHKRAMGLIAKMTPQQLTLAGLSTAKAANTTKNAPFKALKLKELAAIEARQGKTTGAKSVIGNIIGKTLGRQKIDEEIQSLRDMIAMMRLNPQTRTADIKRQEDRISFLETNRKDLASQLGYSLAWARLQYKKRVKGFQGNPAAVRKALGDVLPTTLLDRIAVIKNKDQLFSEVLETLKLKVNGILVPFNGIRTPKRSEADFYRNVILQDIYLTGAATGTMEQLVAQYEIDAQRNLALFTLFEKWVPIIESNPTHKRAILSINQLLHEAGFTHVKNIADFKAITFNTPNAKGVSLADAKQKLEWLADNEIEIAPPPFEFLRSAVLNPFGDGLFGVYTPKDDRIHLFADSLPSPELAQWVAWHELFHRGVSLEHGKNYEAAILEVGQDPTIKALAKAMFLQRSLLQPITRLLAIEEAMAELSAAIRTGDFDSLEMLYGVSIPRGLQSEWRTAFFRFVEKMHKLVREVLKLPPNKYTTASQAKVLEFIESAHIAAAGGTDMARATSSIVPGRFNEAKLSSAAHSPVVDWLFNGSENAKTFLDPDKNTKTIFQDDSVIADIFGDIHQALGPGAVSEESIKATSKIKRREVLKGVFGRGVMKAWSRVTLDKTGNPIAAVKKIRYESGKAVKRLSRRAILIALFDGDDSIASTLPKTKQELKDQITKVYNDTTTITGAESSNILPPNASDIARTRLAEYEGMRVAQLNKEIRKLETKLVRFKNNPTVASAIKMQLQAAKYWHQKKDAARIEAKKGLNPEIFGTKSSFMWTEENSPSLSPLQNQAIKEEKTVQHSNQAQGGHRRGTFENVDQARKGNKALDAAAIKGEKLVKKMLGDLLTGPIEWFLHKKEGGKAWGTFTSSTKGKFIRAAIDSMDPLSTLFHESMHALAVEMANLAEGRVQYEKIAKLAMTPYIQKQLKSLLALDPDALKQLADPNESVAYMFQFHAIGLIRVQPAARNTFKRWAEAFAQLIGYVTQSQSAEQIFDAFKAGDMSTIAGIQDTMANVQHKRAIKALSSVTSPLHKTMSALFQTPVQRLRDTKISALITLASKYFAEAKAGGALGVIQMTAQQHGHWLNRFEGILQDNKTTTRQMQRALRNLQAGKATNKLEKEIRQLFEDLYNYGSKGKGHITVLGTDKNGKQISKKLGYTPNFFPRIWSTKAVLDQIPKLRKLLKDESKAAGMPLSDADINNFIDAVRSGDGIIDIGTSNSSLTPAFAAANVRSFEFITDKNAHKFVEFQEDNMHEIVSKYIRQIVHRREHGRAFGSDGKGVQRLINAAKNAGATAEQIRMAEKAVEAMDGTLNTQNVSAFARNAMVTAMTVVNFAVLPLALFSSLVDPLGVLVRTGSMKAAGNTYVSAVQQLYNDTKHIKGNGQILAEYLGIIERETMLEVIGNTYNGMFMNQTLRKANSFFFKIIGLEQWTRGTRIGALNASLLYLRDAFQDVNPDAAMLKKRATINKELNLQPGDIQPTADGIQIIEIKSVARRKRVEQALFRMVDESVLRPNSAHRPIWMSDMRFILLGHLKQFTFSFHNTINKQVARNFREQRADGKSIASAALVGWPLLTYVPVMIAADMLRDVIAGRSDDEDDNFAETMINGVQRAGIMGLGNIIMDAQRDYKYGKLPINTVAGPTVAKGYDLVRTAVNPDASFTNTLASLLPGAAFWKGWLK